MGRTSRLVNPDDGPLQSFAHDLRQLREKAGNPTYRALAKTAGFSASTLGEAAGGVRRPSLDVTLAFVGACGGDTEAWHERWRQLGEQLSAPVGQEHPSTDVSAAAGQVDTELPPSAGQADANLSVSAGHTAADVSVSAGQVPVDADVSASIGQADTDTSVLAGQIGAEGASAGPETAPAPDDPPAQPPHVPDIHPHVPDDIQRPVHVRRRLLIAALAAAVVSVLAFGVTFLDSKRNGAPAANSATATTTPTASACPAATAKGLFGGSTRASGARVRAGASMADTVIRTVAANCALQFAGYCLGDVVPDPFGGTPDMRWFEVVGGGVVSSAVVHGNPPAAMQPTACADSVPLPSAISLSVTAAADNPDTFELHATGTHVWIVGYATVPSVRTGGTISATSPWQQIGMVSIATSGTALAWSARPSGAGTAAAGLPIVAVACFGGQGPTDVMDAESVSVTNPSSTAPLALTSAERVAAANAACSYQRP